MSTFNSSTNGYFTIDGNSYPLDSVRAEYQLPKTILLWDGNSSTPLFQGDYDTIINEQTGNAFTSMEDMKSFVNENFFRKATVAGGYNGDLSAYAPLASPAFTGIPTAPTATPETYTTQLATSAFVQDVLKRNGVFDYVISKDADGTVATPKFGRGLAIITGTDYQVLQGAVDALSTGQGGSIYVERGTYNLSGNELTITGWSDTRPVNAQLKLVGSGYSTVFSQTASIKNAIIVKNQASVVLKDFLTYTGENSLSGILLDSTGTKEMSVWGGLIENVFCQSDSTQAPAFYAKNFFDVKFSHIQAISSAHDGMRIDNVSTGTHYGNSVFEYIRVACGSLSKGEFAALRLYTENFRTMNLNQFNAVDAINGDIVGAAYGILVDGCSHNTFSLVDVEEFKYPITFRGTSGRQCIGNVITSGYFIVKEGTGGCGITTSAETSGCNFMGLKCQVLETTPIVNDLTPDHLAANVYDLVIIGNNNPAPKIALTHPGTIIDYRIHSGGPTVSWRPKPDASDNSRKIATTSWVTDKLAAFTPSAPAKRRSFWEALGNSNTAVGTISFNVQSANNALTAVSSTGTNFFTKRRRARMVSATTAQARAGLYANPNVIKEEGFIMKIQFGIAAYNAGHRYQVGLTSSADTAVDMASQTQTIALYANPGDTNWKIVSNGNTTSAPVDLGANFPVNTSGVDYYELTLTLPANSNSLSYVLKRLNTAFVASGTLNSAPSNGIFLSPFIIANNLATGIAAQVDVSYATLETDY